MYTVPNASVHGFKTFSITFSFQDACLQCVFSPSANICSTFCVLSTLRESRDARENEIIKISVLVTLVVSSGIKRDKEALPHTRKGLGQRNLSGVRETAGQLFENG